MKKLLSITPSVARNCFIVPDIAVIPLITLFALKANRKN